MSQQLPENCRQRLQADGKAYPKSNCAECGQFSPRWREYDAVLASELVPVPGDAGQLRNRLEAARARFNRWNGRLIESLREERVAVTRLTAERDGLLAEVQRLRSIQSFEDAVACVFDNLKFAAANTDDKEWDERLEDLAEDVIEYAPRYKKQWKDILKLGREKDALQSELTKVREELYRAENPPFTGRMDTWQAACGKARREAEEIRLELTKARQFLDQENDENTVLRGALKDVLDWIECSQSSTALRSIAQNALDYSALAAKDGA